MKYSDALYFSVALYSNQSYESVIEYAIDASKLFTDIPLKIEAVAIKRSLDVKKYRKRNFSKDAISVFLDTAIKENRDELGIYISSQDYSRESVPSFIVNVHLALSNTIGGKSIEEQPTAFLILAVQTKSSSLITIREFVDNSSINILRGGIWENRQYEQYGASIEWAYKNYPVAKTNCSLKEWNPNFDREFAQQRLSVRTRFPRR